MNHVNTNFMIPILFSTTKCHPHMVTLNPPISGNILGRADRYRTLTPHHQQPQNEPSQHKLRSRFFPQVGQQTHPVGPLNRRLKYVQPIVSCYNMLGNEVEKLPNLPAIAGGERILTKIQQTSNSSRLEEINREPPPVLKKE